MVVIKKSARFPFERKIHQIVQKVVLWSFHWNCCVLCVMPVFFFFVSFKSAFVSFFTTVICIIDFIEFVSQIVVLLLWTSYERDEETDTYTASAAAPSFDNNIRKSTFSCHRHLSSVIQCSMMYLSQKKTTSATKPRKSTQSRTNVYSVASKGELIDFQTCFTLHSKCLAVNL